jgi:hypothetical protein
LFSISIFVLQAAHTGRNIKEELSAVLAEFDVGLQKVAALTTDNGSNVVNAAAQMNVNPNGTPVVVSPQEAIDKAARDLTIERVPCFAHTLNLIVNDAVFNGSASPAMSDICNLIYKGMCSGEGLLCRADARSSFAAVKKLVKRFRKSSLLSQALKDSVSNENKVRLGPLRAAEKALETARLKLKEAEDADKPSRKRIARRQDALKAAQEALVVAKESAARTPKLEVKKLKQHVETRWNSVYVMLERLVLLRAPVVTVCVANTGETAGKVRDCGLFIFSPCSPCYC